MSTNYYPPTMSDPADVPEVPLGDYVVTFTLGKSYSEAEFHSEMAAELFYAMACSFSQKTVRLWIEGECRQERKMLV